MWSRFHRFFKFLYNLGVFLKNFAEKKKVTCGYLTICYMEEYLSGCFFPPSFGTNF